MVMEGLRKENCTKTYLLFRQYGAGTEVQSHICHILSSILMENIPTMHVILVDENNEHLNGYGGTKKR